MTSYLRVGFLKGIIDLLGGIRFRHTDLYRVAGMRFLLGACAETLKTLLVSPLGTLTCHRTCRFGARSCSVIHCLQGTGSPARMLSTVTSDPGILRDRRLLQGLRLPWCEPSMDLPQQFFLSNVGNLNSGGGLVASQAIRSG